MTTEQRLERLERWMQRIAGEKEGELPDLQVRSLKVMDQDGVPRVVIGMAADGWPILSLQDKNGKARVYISAPYDSPGLCLQDEHGRASAGLTVGPDHTPALILQDERGEIRVMFHSPRDGPALHVYDEGGQSRARFCVDAAGSPSVKFTGARGNVIWQAPR